MVNKDPAGQYLRYQRKTTSRVRRPQLHCLPGIELSVASILERLCEEGWAEELNHMNYWDMYKFVKIPSLRLPKPLTDAGKLHYLHPLQRLDATAPHLAEWPRVMNAVQATLDKAHADLNAHKIQIGLRMRYSNLEDAIREHCVQLPRTPYMLHYPIPIDFAFTPKCRAALEHPLKFDYPTDHSDPFERMAPALVKKWNTNVKKKLTRYVRRHLRRIPPGVDPLNLAVAVFTCGHCAAGVRYPEVLRHPCLRLRPEAGNLPIAEDDLYTRIITRPNFINEKYELNEEQKPLHRRCMPFDADRLQNGPMAIVNVDRMRRVVSGLGLDAVRTTTDELKACGGWLRCTLCEPGGPEEPVKRVYDWVAAVSFL